MTATNPVGMAAMIIAATIAPMVMGAMIIRAAMAINTMILEVVIMTIMVIKDIKAKATINTDIHIIIMTGRKGLTCIPMTRIMLIIHTMEPGGRMRRICRL
ncbi:MAG: hypothetical protein FWF88_02495 [Peptococcaceae bacterium]|nr:hypothetical protein [Peptococcaceae bacterium]